MSDAEQEYGTYQAPDEDRDPDDDAPDAAEVPYECGRIWGYHREHMCIEPEGHAADGSAHFCDCDAEADEDDLVRQEAEQ